MSKKKKSDESTELVLLSGLDPKISKLTVEDFLDSVLQHYGKDFFDSVLLLFQNKYWQSLSKKFFLEDDVLEMYNVVHEFIQQNNLMPDDEERRHLIDIAKSIKALNGVTSLKKLKDMGYDEYSTNYEDLEQSIEMLSEILADVWERTTHKYEHVHNIERKLLRVHTLKKDFYDTLKNAGATTTVFADSKSGSDYIDDIEGEEKNLTKELLNNKRLRKDKDIFGE